MHATPSDFPLAIASIAVNGDLPVPIYEQISRAIRNAIETGELPEGTLLPTGRELARALGVSRNTVVAAYSRLVAENYLVANTRRGTQVAKSPFAAAPFENPSADRSKKSTDEFAGAGRIEIGFRARQFLRVPLVRASLARPFALHVPDASFYPRNPLGRLLSEEFCRSPVGEDQHAWQRFQTAISVHLRQMRGVHCEPQQVIPLTGMDSALDLTARVMIDPGHCVLIEDPAAGGISETFAAAGARIYRLPGDASGADPARSASPPPRLIVVSPSLSFPYGRQMTDERRASVLDYARRSGALVFEADSYWELSHTGSRLRAIQGCDRDGTVLYFGSLNETLGPQIRVGYLVVPTALVDAFAEMAQRIAYGPDNFILSALARFIEDGQYAMHIKAIRSAYARRLGIAVAACRTHLRGAACIEPRGGFHLTLILPPHFDEIEICRLAALHGLQVSPLAAFHGATAPHKGIVVGFGSVPDRIVETMVRRLAEIIARSQAEGRPLELAS
ncbi:MAG: PLP-dependent aminotransferase family protein [Rhizomicrobium sp.]